ncbi:MAG: prephenate dehydrogenase/arogenate dehydrogenase family protein [Firmicutes bacterium]|nr:prephenate dehydrogenase/arogenate dehydrogenase family protein [Bacillota bacterium]
MSNTRLAIYGLGLIGTSVGLAVRGLLHEWEVWGVDPNASHAAVAYSRGAVDRIANADEAADWAEIHLIAAPPRESVALLASLPFLEGSIVTDTCGIKKPIARWMPVLAQRGIRLIPGHPMSGSERSGPSAADGALFDGASWLLTPTTTEDPLPASLQAVLMACRAHPVILSAALHDRYVAAFSQLPHLLAAVVAAVGNTTAEGDPKAWAFAAGSFRSATRVALSDPQLWSVLAVENRELLLPVVQETQHRLDRMARLLREGDESGLLAMLQEGQAAKRTLDRATDSDT